MTKTTHQIGGRSPFPIITNFLDYAAKRFGKPETQPQPIESNRPLERKEASKP